MAIQYKADVLALLKAAGYPSTRIRAEKLLGQSYVQQLRKGELISWAALNTVCRLLDCQPGDLLEYVADEIPNAETIAAIKELDNGGGEHFTGSTEELVKKLLDEPAGEE
jgi:putative transcriptional regulator